MLSGGLSQVSSIRAERVARTDHGVPVSCGVPVVRYRLTPGRKQPSGCGVQSTQRSQAREFSSPVCGQLRGENQVPTILTRECRGRFTVCQSGTVRENAEGPAGGDVHRMCDQLLAAHRLAVYQEGRERGGDPGELLGELLRRAAGADHPLQIGVRVAAAAGAPARGSRFVKRAEDRREQNFRLQ
jgi:hypothetical protein